MATQNHETGRLQCAGSNKKGRRCGSRPAVDSEYCIDHQQQAERPALRWGRSPIASKPPLLTTISAIGTGTALTLVTALVPQYWTPDWANDFVSSRTYLVGLCIASMILAVFILTYERGQHWLTVLSTLAIAICTWAAALIPFQDKPLWEGMSALIFTSPIMIALLGPQITKLSLRNIGFVVLLLSIVGILLVVIIDGTVIGGYIQIIVGPQAYIGFGAVIAYVLMIGLLFALLIGAAKLRGSAMAANDRGR